MGGPYFKTFYPFLLCSYPDSDDFYNKCLVWLHVNQIDDNSATWIRAHMT